METIKNKLNQNINLCFNQRMMLVLILIKQKSKVCDLIESLTYSGLNF